MSGSGFGPRLVPFLVLAALLAGQVTLAQRIEPDASVGLEAGIGTGAPIPGRGDTGPAGAVADHVRDSLLPAPPPTWLARWAMLGEARTAAYLAVLRVQTADAGRGVGRDAIRPGELDPGRVLEWLDHALALDPSTAYPLLLAARVHAEVHGADGGRLVLEWLRRRFAEQPEQRWPWLAHGVYVARHVLGDVALASSLAAELRTRATGPSVPGWVRQIEPLLLADLGQLEAARTLVGALVASGAIRDPSELSFLSARLRRLEEAPPGRHPSTESSRSSKGVSRE